MDVMIFVVLFAAEQVHRQVALYNKIIPYNLDALQNVLNFMYVKWEAKATPCIFKSLAMNELLLLSLMSFDEKLLSLANFSKRQKSLRSPKSFHVFVALSN